MDGTPGERVLNMGKGSVWDISLNGVGGNAPQEWLNNTTVNMDGSSIRIASGSKLTFERFNSKIVTLSTATGMSSIEGEGNLMLGGSTPTLGNINNHSGILLEINSGAFTINDTNTADLKISASLVNGSYRGGLLKAGDGIMELTNANSNYSNDVYVTAGTLKTSGAGTVGSGALTVDSGAPLANTGAITLGASTIFDVTNLTPTNGYIVLIDGGSVSGYEDISADNIRGWSDDVVLSLVSGNLVLSSEALTATDIYWNSTDTTWSSGTTYENASGDSVTAGTLDNIIFNNVTTSLRLGSNISNSVSLINNTKLTLTLGTYGLNGPVDIAQDSTLTIVDTITSTGGGWDKPTWTGSGTIRLTFGTSNHDANINMPEFSGTVAVSGWFNLGTSTLGTDASWRLTNVNAWSTGDDPFIIANDAYMEDVTLRPNGTYTFTGVVTGKSVTVGSANAANVVFSNKASAIDNVYVESGRSVTYNDGTANNGDTLFTANTHVAAGGSITLTPGTASADAATDARQYEGAIYLNGTTDSAARLVLTDGCINITGGLHVGESGDSGKAGSLTVRWDKNHFINGLYGTDSTLTIGRDSQGSYYDGNAKYIILTGAGDFTGTLNLNSSLAEGSDLNFGLMVLGESNSAEALKGTVANFVDATSSTALVFTKSESIISKDNFANNENFQTDYAANGTLAGLSGSNGTVFAKELTVSGSGQYSYSGGLSVSKLIVNMQGEDSRQGLSGNYDNLNVEVQGGMLEVSGALTLQGISTTGGGSLYWDLDQETVGTLTLGQDPTERLLISLNGGTEGTYTLFAGSSIPDASLIDLTHLDRNFSATYSNGVVTLTQVSEGSLELTWNTAGNDGVWSTDTTKDWTSSGASVNFHDGDSVIFGAAASPQAITVSGTVKPASMSFTADSADYAFTLEQGAVLELGTASDNPSVEEQRVFEKAGDSTVSISGGTFKLVQRSIFDISGGSVELNSDIDIDGTQKAIVKEGAGTLVMGGHLTGNAVDGFRLEVNEGNVLFASNSPCLDRNNPSTNNMLDKLLMGENLITVAEGSLIGIGGRGSEDTYMFFTTNSLNYVEGGVTSKLYLDKTGSGTTTIEYVPENNSFTDTTFRKLIGSGSGDDGNLVLLRYAGSNQSPWNITLKDERAEGEQLFHGKLTIATNAWAGTGSDANMLLTVEDEDVLSKAVVELIGQTNPDVATGYGAFALGVETVQVAGLTTVEGMTNIPNGTNIPGGSTGERIRLVLGSNVTSATLSINTEAGADYTYSGAVGVGISIEKKGAGSQSFSGDMSAFNGNVTLAAGTLGFTGGLSISSSQTLALTHGATLNADLNLTGGTLSVTAVADTAAASLNGKALTLGGGTALVLSGIESSAIDSYTQINLLSNIGSVLGGDGSTLSLADGVAYSQYFSSITGLSDTVLGSAKLALKDGNLCLTFEDLTPPEWVWDNAEGTGVWSNDNDDNWANTSGNNNPSGADVWFRGAGEGTVTISGTVTPSSVTVTGGAYTFTGGVINLSGTGSLNIDGSSAAVTLGSAGVVSNGSVELKSGKLVLAADNALAADASLVFEGGLLSYAEGATYTDFNNRITAADGSMVRVEVQGADNAVTWGSTTGLRSANSGVNAALVNGIEKTGEGTLTIQWLQRGTNNADVNNAVISGDMIVSEGVLYLKSGDSGNPAYTFSGSIEVAKNATFVFDAHTNTKSGTGNQPKHFDFNGQISGDGTLILGKSTINSSVPTYGSVELNGDNTGFHGIWQLWGGSGTGDVSRISFATENSLGASDATLELHGVYFYIDTTDNLKTIAQNICVVEGTNNFGTSSGVDKGYTFTGTLTGNEGATLKSSVSTNTHVFSGNISEFYGTLENTSCTITLGGAGIASAGGTGNASIINAQYLYGAGTYIINYSQDTILNSAVGTNNGTGTSSTSLTHAGSGKLILANAGNLSTQTLTLNNNTVQIGYVDGEGTVHNGNWAGTVAQASDTTGTLELVAGRLDSNTALDNYTGNVVVNVGSERADGGSSFDYGNNSTSRLTSVSVNGDNGGQLTNIGSFTVGGSSSCTTLNAIFGTGNVGTSATAGSGSTSLISQTDGSTLTLQGGAGTTINMTIDAIISTLQAHKDANSRSYLYLTDGTLDIEDPDAITFGSQTNILNQLGIRFVGAEGGALVLSGVADGMYIASADDPASQTVRGYNIMQLYKAVAVEKDTTFRLVLNGAPEGMDTTLNNLMGGTGSRFVVENTGTGTAVVTLNNELMSGIDSPEGSEKWAPDGTAGADTIFAGSISTTGGDVQFIKTGAGTLTIGGDLVASALDLAEGGITLKGQGSEIETLTDSGETAKTLTVDGTLTLMGSGDAASVLDNGTRLDGDGVLALEGATLSLSNGAAIAGLAVDVDEDSLLDAGSGSHLLSSLAGEGEVRGSNATLTIDPAQDATFSGSLTGTGLLNVNEGKGATQTFSGVQGAGWSVENGGSLTLQNGANGETNAFSSLTLGAGSTTTLLVSSTGAEVFTLTGNLVVENGATIKVATFDEENFNGYSYTLGSAAGLATEGDYNLEMGVGFMRFEATGLQELDGKIVLTLTRIENNLYEDVADSHNAHAGAELLWHADVTGTKDLKGISEAVEAAIAYGDRAEANRLMAAAAGASIATLGSAFSSDVDRQLRAIRNRTATMGVNQSQVNEDMPYFNAWVNAEGDYRKVEKDGTAAGYTLSSWGGTVGFDVDVNPSLTAGLALTAMYGDMDTDGPDRAEGDLDTYYVSLFARYASSAWTHTFIATIGMADASLDRTVNYGGGSYRTTGDTEGVGVGLMYEVGYVIPLNEDATACLQPVFNVAWRHTSINSYTESGSDAALHADDQTMDVVTFGLGARFQSAVAENLYNRTALFEARALLKVDAGDRKSDLDVALLHGTGCGNIESAELGAVGVELGAGLTIPVGSDGGSLFLDGSAELRSGYTNLNGTVGYRINF